MCIANKYYAESIIAKGGQSTVYLVRHHQLKRKAERALKVLSSEHLSSPDDIKRFHREVQVTAELSQLNQHIVRIYDDFGEIPYLGYFYVMEHLQGELLSKTLKKQTQPAPFSWSLDILFQLCDALETAHHDNVIHRDIKPSNLMLLPRNQSTPFLKVLDWGIAKMLDAQRITSPLTQVSVGTPLYMSPEQITNQAIDTRTDIYNVGILLFELLTGSHPFVSHTTSAKHEQKAQALQAQLHQPPPSLKDTPAHECASLLDPIIQQAMAKHPDDRPATIQQLQQLLKQAAPSTIPLHPIPTNRQQQDTILDGLPSGELSFSPTPHTLSHGQQSTPPSSHITVGPAQQTNETEPHTNTQEILQEAYPSQHKHMMYITLSMLGVAVVLVLVWWLPSRPPQPGNQQPTPTKAKLSRTIPTPTPPPAPPRTPARVTPTIPDTPAYTPARPVPRQTVAPTPLRKRVQTTKKRRRTRPKTRRITRTKQRNTTTCPSSSLWMKIAPFLSGKAEVIAEGGKITRKLSGGVCVSHQTKRLSIMQQGYALCIFTLPKGRKRFSLVLQPESGLHTPNYCLK